MTLALRKSRAILPGFGLTMGFTVAYLSLIVIIPLAGLFLKSARLPWSSIHANLTDSEFIASLKITFGLSLLAALINAVFGFIIAWVLVRYRFPGRRLIDGLIDLPFALPTAVSGITLATLYTYAPTAKGWLGIVWHAIYAFVNPLWKPLAAGLNGSLSFLHIAQLLAWIGLPDGVASELPDQFAYTRFGMLLALIFIGAPFVVRTLQPALEDLDAEVEEAAASLGATRGQTFRRILFPALLPALLSGFSLSFGRAVGEYGSVIFISSNQQGSEITAHLIMKKLEGYDYGGATLLGLIMLLTSFAMLAVINGSQWWVSRRTRGGVA